MSVDSKGVERLVDNEAQRYSWPRISADRRIAVEIAGAVGGYDLWLHALDNGTLTRLTNTFTGVRSTGWSSDGRRIAYLDMKGGGTASVRRKAVRADQLHWQNGGAL